MGIKQKNRALWWQFPSLLDTPAGPWSAEVSRLNNEPLTHWKRAIDWMADLGANVFIGNLVSHLKTNWFRDCTDWCFALVCQWPDFPHAQVFPSRHLQRNRELANAIIEHFHNRGIRVFLHHYNFFAPYQWFIRQEELVKRTHRPDGTASPGFDIDVNSSRLLASSVCPNEPKYREFIKASWQEMFEHLPQLDGLLISVGESNGCVCQECTGGVPVDARWRHTIRKEQLQTFSQFADFYVQTLKSLGKEPMLRCWHGGGDSSFARAFPKGPVYVIKYSGFNSIDCGPDPIYKLWKRAGHRLWAIHEVSGAEPGALATWMNPQWVAKVNQRAVKEMGIEGSVAFHNAYHGGLDLNYPPIFFNMEAALRFFGGDDYNEAFFKKRAQELMGPNGPTYLEAGKLYSQIILNIDKVVSYPSDGIAFCLNFFLVGNPMTDFPGVVGELGMNGLEPHPWTRGNVAVLRRYREYLDDHPWTENIYDLAIPKGRIEPLAFLKEKWDLAREGLKLVEGLDLDHEDRNATIHKIIQLSARWAVELGRFWFNFTRAKVLWWGANSLRTELGTQKRLACECLAALGQVQQAMWEICGIYYEFPPDYTQWSKGLNRKGLQEKLSHYRKIKLEIQEYFQLLLEDKVFKWPVIAQFDWPE